MKEAVIRGIVETAGLRLHRMTCQCGQAALSEDGSWSATWWPSRGHSIVATVGLPLDQADVVTAHRYMLSDGAAFMTRVVFSTLDELRAGLAPARSRILAGESEYRLGEPDFSLENVADGVHLDRVALLADVSRTPGETDEELRERLLARIKP